MTGYEVLVIPIVLLIFAKVEVRMYLWEYVCGLFGRSMLYALVELPSE